MGILIKNVTIVVMRLQKILSFALSAEIAFKY